MLRCLNKRWQILYSLEASPITWLGPWPHHNDADFKNAFDNVLR